MLKDRTRAEVWRAQFLKKRQSIADDKLMVKELLRRQVEGSPWNAETTARLPEQFYTPMVSHLSHKPHPTLNLVSSLCLHLFCVSVQDVRSQAARNLSQMSQGKWCVKQTRGVVCVVGVESREKPQWVGAPWVLRAVFVYLREHRSSH